jgi:hypothetical protein
MKNRDGAQMQPDQITWEGFTARQAAAETDEEPQIPPKPAKNRRSEPSLANLMMEAIHLAGSRRGRLSRADRIREQTLLAVLSEAIRR